MIRYALPLIMLAACSNAQGTPDSANSTKEAALARSVLSDLQAQSFVLNREFCGYIGLDSAGILIASAATQGTLDSCLADDPPEIAVITASYHTHGAYSPDYINEVPSVDDFEADEAEGIDGYVATPGGRLWYIDTQDGQISQICGIGCLPSDPEFVADAPGTIAQSYSYDELVTVFEN